MSQKMPEIDTWSRVQIWINFKYKKMGLSWWIYNYILINPRDDKNGRGLIVCDFIFIAIYVKVSQTTVNPSAPTYQIYLIDF